MVLQKSTPPLPRIVLETLFGALCFFALPLAFAWLGEDLRGSGGSMRVISALIVSAIGILLLLDVYRMMCQRTNVASHRTEENTGSTAL